MYHHRKRRDANHAEIADALRGCGWSLLDTSQLGESAPDLIIARAGVVVAVEIKGPTGRLKPGQAAWLSSWPGPTCVLRSVDEALALRPFVPPASSMSAGSGGPGRRPTSAR